MNSFMSSIVLATRLDSFGVIGSVENALKGDSFSKPFETIFAKRRLRQTSTLVIRYSAAGEDAQGKRERLLLGGNQCAVS